MQETKYSTKGLTGFSTLLNQQEMHSNIRNDDESTREDSKTNHVVPERKRIEAKSTED